MRAAQIYLQKSKGRDQVIADALSDMIEKARKDDDPDDGEAGSPAAVGA